MSKSIKQGPISADGRSLATLIKHYYRRYCKSFRELTVRAKHRFEDRDWRGIRKDALLRLDLYGDMLDDIKNSICASLGDRARYLPIWSSAKKAYAALIAGQHDIELAETFFNSVTRRLLQTPGVNRKVEFFHRHPRHQNRSKSKPVFRTYRVLSTTEAAIRQVLKDYHFRVPFEDLSRDAARVASEINLYLWPMISDNKLEAIEMVRAPFYRNKVAYLVGRIRTNGNLIPLILPLYNDKKSIYVDAALFRERQLSIVFGFAHTCFRVEIELHDALIDFLRSIMPHKPIAELYFAIGYNRHGKTEFYRDLHRFVHVSEERFEIAPGKEGSVMIGFTLPHFNFVFKVIKDRPCYLRSHDIPTKLVTREHVMHRYQCVCYRDRVGRMVDTQEFENLRFRRKRFSSQLLREFTRAARDSVTVDEDYVTIHHLYLQRRVVPLPMYLINEKDPELVRQIIIDYGYFLKDLAAVGIFPADLFNVWNCGVTSRRRVVLFDYDDVELLTDINFMIKPQPHDDLDELLPEEQRIAATPNDFFMDEIERFLGIPDTLRGVFLQTHGNLFSVDFWHTMQRRVRRGDIVDIIPYNRAKRFERHPTKN